MRMSGDEAREGVRLCPQADGDSLKDFFLKDSELVRFALYKVTPL